ncbi:class I mannose-6-phosphate isomerase [Streptomyces sp. NBC_01022]|uniref:class I mannose-6-phosphate isomerase n=1 Tax=Streptomyces sp. NBC_01022 TaxID=2903723 RepID=UPI002DD9E36E|nr:class I mannose-6-phosphate isomerase [Streptomyces sp. NBC_01022]WRZ78785.1 class I mannose-6-phosphate isomerase [Streptomyces sp. NBC_01022]WRZ86894.1 class I mannose-6-phosphate isomerase [Streptomyces sp. NBC_01022]
MHQPRPYERNPRYAATGGTVVTGWTAAVADLPTAPTVLALDGPAALDWEEAAGSLAAALRARGTEVTVCDVRGLWSAAAVERLCVPAADADAFFLPLAEFSMGDLFETPPVQQRPHAGVLLAYGPGAALAEPDLLWWADLPKRYAEEAVTRGELPLGANLGRPGTPGELRSLFYTDWPVGDRHRDAFAHRVDRWVDLQGEDPASLDGAAVRATLAALATGPVRTRPFFNSTPWGGQWAARELGFDPLGGNTALGYELIAPEAGILVGQDAAAQVEIPFQLLCELHPEEFLGPDVHRRYGTSFPIRFDYLDTVGGGNLSLHLHPQEQYMRETFGWPYTQHETYYVTASEPGAQIYLGLRDSTDVDVMRKEVEAAAADGLPLRVEDHVMTHPADTGQLFMIPAGTPHSSGEGNLVLEISATPYLYSLRFYDWLRKGTSGAPRPLSYAHGFANLDTSRRGEDVLKDLVQQPRTVREGQGWREEIVGELPGMFYAVHRFVIEGPEAAEDDTAGRFHILNVSAGDGVVVETAGGLRHDLAFAETLTVPASVGPYRLHPVGSRPVHVVKSLVTQV